MRSRVERRHPERQRHLLKLLRGLALTCLAIAAALLVVPRVMAELGLIGPGTDERIAAAERGVAAAQAYGADGTAPALAGAVRELDRARSLAIRGENRAARHAAQRAASLAVEAQRIALANQQRTRRRAEEVVADLDRQVNDLERLYNAVTPGLDRAAVSGLLSRMKRARVAAATVFLAHDEKRFADAVALESAAREALAETRAALEAARRPAPPAAR